MEELTVGEAAERLGISEQAVRKRVQRGTLPCAKPSDGHVYVYLDSETNTVVKESETGSANQATLQYIDKLFASYQALMAAQGRAYLAMTTLSTVLLSISGGAASAEGKLAIAGFGLTVPVAVFLIGGAVLVALLAVATQGTQIQTESLKREIRTLYSIIGFYHRTLSGMVVNPFRVSTMREPLLSWYLTETYPIPVRYGQTESSRASILDALLHFLMMSFFSIALPTAAVIGTGFKVNELLHGRESGWIWILVVVILGFLVAAHTIIGYRGMNAFAITEEVEGWGSVSRIVDSIFVVFAPTSLAALVGSGLGYFVANVLGAG